MMSKKKKKKKKKQANSTAKRVLDVLLSVALIAGVTCGGVFVAARTVPISQDKVYHTASTEPATEAATEPTGSLYDSTDVKNTAVFDSPLILVNNDYPCLSGEEGLVSLYEKKTEVDSHSFSVRDDTVQVRSEMADALIAMLDAFYQETSDDNIVVQSGYRSKDRQQELYDASLAETGEEHSETVSKPGYSEHQTGWGVDLSLYDGSEYDGTGVYAWINEHCGEYGIVPRYPEDKTDITGLAAEPWHYRYVGKPHASYMVANHLTLEEYIDLLKKYPYDGEHLTITDADGKNYEVYYYHEDAGYDTTSIPVPSNREYTVSGNNVDGFIITAPAEATASTEPAGGTPEVPGGEPAATAPGETAPGETAPGETTPGETAPGETTAAAGGDAASTQGSTESATPVSTEPPAATTAPAGTTPASPSP